MSAEIVQFLNDGVYRDFVFMMALCSVPSADRRTVSQDLLRSQTPISKIEPAAANPDVQSFNGPNKRISFDRSCPPREHDRPENQAESSAHRALMQ